MISSIQKKKLQIILNEYGISKQLEMAIEEFSEFIVDIQHYKRERSNLIDLLPECIDSFIVLNQILLIYDSKVINELINMKITREINRIKEKSIDN